MKQAAFLSIALFITLRRFFYYCTPAPSRCTSTRAHYCELSWLQLICKQYSDRGYLSRDYTLDNCRVQVANRSCSASRLLRSAGVTNNKCAERAASITFHRDVMAMDERAPSFIRICYVCHAKSLRCTCSLCCFSTAEDNRGDIWLGEKDGKK